MSLFDAVSSRDSQRAAGLASRQKIGQVASIQSTQLNTGKSATTVIAGSPGSGVCRRLGEPRPELDIDMNLNHPSPDGTRMLEASLGVIRNVQMTA